MNNAPEPRTPPLKEYLVPFMLPGDDQLVATASEGFPPHIQLELDKKLAASAWMLVDQRSRPSS